MVRALSVCVILSSDDFGTIPSLCAGSSTQLPEKFGCDCAASGPATTVARANSVVTMRRIISPGVECRLLLLGRLGRLGRCVTEHLRFAFVRELHVGTL